MDATIEDGVGLQLIELTSITDVYADGLHRIELLGDCVRLVYFRWKTTEDGHWQRVAADIAVVCPRSVLRARDMWPNVPVIGPPSQRVPLRMN
jgi:hypothetical protein